MADNVIGPFLVYLPVQRPMTSAEGGEAELPWVFAAGTASSLTFVPASLGRTFSSPCRFLYEVIREIDAS